MKYSSGQRLRFTIGNSTLIGEVTDVLHTIIGVRLDGTWLRTNYVINDMRDVTVEDPTP